MSWKKLEDAGGCEEEKVIRLTGRRKKKLYAPAYRGWTWAESALTT
jgi:DNA-binding PadR family transcriptional regulator